ncbi:LacI family DNA-binding transcriptional regulator [Pedobacter sp. MC2016-24]|uniref:LacI family DNA-binding transcriptional regulator n=1 Tax=Pedobacter sp. MC2016-24 TaxID=2780090 RepID=UPI001880C281|nr:substrate-binding domain-containing protein [Pedobacter sp. MC2016-24]MBE9601221.1 substrate-binding domain-containing protein [Pedobacter sp. MC2016-24]
MAKLSIKDIAQRCNTSITTVSFVLNGKADEKRISVELKEKILKTIEDTGYKQNQFARGMRTGKTNIIGLIIEDISNAFFSAVARIIEEDAYKRGYKIIYCSTDDNTEKTKELIKLFVERNLDGYIITPPKGVEDEIQSLIDRKIPVVLFDRYFPGLETDYVVVDNFNTSKKAVQHLFDSGFEHIALVTTSSDQNQMLERLNGYEKTILENGKEPKILKIPFTCSPEQSVKEIVTYLKENKEVDAIFFSTNYLAFKGLEAINQLKLTIPDDFAVVAFDDQDFFRIYNPSITAVAQPVRDISLKLIDIILQKMNSEEKLVEKVVLSTNLIVRDSSVKRCIK